MGKLNEFNRALRAYTESLQGTAIGNEQARAQATLRLEQFFERGSAAFSDYALKFSEAQAQLALVEQRLAQQVELNGILTRRNELTADRFEDNTRRGEATINRIEGLMGSYLQSSMGMFRPRHPRVLITYGSPLLAITDSSDSSSDSKEHPMSKAVVVHSTAAAAPAAPCLFS